MRTNVYDTGRWSARARATAQTAVPPPGTALMLRASPRRGPRILLTGTSVQFGKTLKLAVHIGPRCWPSTMGQRVQT